MPNNNILEIVLELLAKNKEGDYWDFKQEYNKNHDMLHDIICMANQTSHKGDRYLIYGVAEDKGALGVCGLAEHKKQADILDCLRARKFAHCPPDIELIDLEHNNKKLDVIVIKDKPLKPYYLLEDIKKESKVVLRAGAIYTRVGDTNTPKDSTANLYETEQMWRERFGIDLPISERLSYLIRETEQWKLVTAQEETLYHHKYFPEFKIKIEYEGACYGNTYTVFYLNETVIGGIASLYFHGTLLEKIGVLGCDGGRLSLVDTEYKLLRRDTLKLSKLPKVLYFPYYLKDNIQFSLLRILNLNNSHCWSSQGVLWNDGILVFKTEQHLNQFTSYLVEHLDDSVEYKPRQISHAKYKKKQETVDFHLKCYAMWKEWQESLILNI